MRRDLAWIGAMNSRNARKDRPVESRPRVVLLTNRVTELYGSGVAGDRFLASWRGLRDMMLRRVGWQFTLKNHPYCDYHRLYQTIGAGVENLAIRTDSAREVLQEADVAVLVNCPSTVAVEAVGGCVPLVHLKDAYWRGERFASPIEKGLCIVVKSVAQLEVELSRLVSDTEYRQAVLARQREALKELLCAVGAEAAGRLDQFVRSVMAKTSTGVPDPLGRTLVELLLSDIELDWHEESKLVNTLAMYCRNPESVRESCAGLILAYPEGLKDGIWEAASERYRLAKSPWFGGCLFCYLFWKLPRELRISFGLFRWRLADVLANAALDRGIAYLPAVAIARLLTIRQSLSSLWKRIHPEFRSQNEERTIAS
jgi:hypothetical protein